ncbi:putative H/ACA ribonucleoprotein complex, subunit Gar1/Naf1 [Helianthus debilis subsp. tardiflorus]
MKVSSFVHACEEDAVTQLTNEKIPYFNAPIYLPNKTQIGKVDEIFGPINEYFFSVKMLERIIATSYAAGDKFYIDLAKPLPLALFLLQPKHVLENQVEEMADVGVVEVVVVAVVEVLSVVEVLQEVAEVVVFVVVVVGVAVVLVGAVGDHRTRC